jgi:hypothetical protein
MVYILALFGLFGQLFKKFGNVFQIIWSPWSCPCLKMSSANSSLDKLCTYEKMCLVNTNVCRKKGLLLSFVYKFGKVACRHC